MLDDQIEKDFIDLFDEDDCIKLNALLLKKEWILDKFYIPYSLTYQGENGCEDDMDILYNSALPFRSLPLRQAKDPKTLSQIKLFNSRFMYCKVYRSLPTRVNDDVFYVEADFKGLTKEAYKTLVAAFFFCLPSFRMDSIFPDSDIRSIFKNAMEGTRNEAVIILDKRHLLKGMYKIGCLKKLYTYSDMPEKEEKLLMKVADYLNIRTVMVHV